MKIVAIVLDIWLDTFPVPKVKKFFEISLFYWIHVMILEKMRPCFVKIAASVLELLLDLFSGTKWSKLSFWVIAMSTSVPILSANFPH